MHCYLLDNMLLLLLLQKKIIFYEIYGHEDKTKRHLFTIHVFLYNYFLCRVRSELLLVHTEGFTNVSSDFFFVFFNAHKNIYCCIMLL